MSSKQQCSFCKRRATTMVSDINDFFPCCEPCSIAWTKDPGFNKETPRTAKEPRQ